MKVEQLLQDKAYLKKLYQEVEDELKKLQGTMSNLQAQQDTIISDKDQLVGELNIVTAVNLKAEKGALEWEVSYDTQKDYLDHLTFLIRLHLDKLPAEVSMEIVSLPGECDVVADPISRHAHKVASPGGNAIAVDGVELGEVDVVDDTKLVA